MRFLSQDMDCGKFRKRFVLFYEEKFITFIHQNCSLTEILFSVFYFNFLTHNFPCFKKDL